MKVDGKDYKILGDCHIVETHSSNSKFVLFSIKIDISRLITLNQRKKDQAIDIIEANCHLGKHCLLKYYYTTGVFTAFILSLILMFPIAF